MISKTGSPKLAKEQHIYELKVHYQLSEPSHIAIVQLSERMFAATTFESNVPNKSYCHKLKCWFVCDINGNVFKIDSKTAS